MSSSVGRYFLYGVGEVLLIFLGISLAVAFDDAAERERQDAITLGLITSLRSDLVANVTELEFNLFADSINLDAVGRVLSHLSSSTVWADSLDIHLGQALHWSSPFLSESGYEGLKQRGLYLVADSTLMVNIPHLFDVSYGRLVGDLDRAMWVFMESVIMPIKTRELVRTDSSEGQIRSRLAPKDYAATRSRGELRTMLLDHQEYLRFGGVVRRQALAETNDLIQAVDQYLESMTRE